MPFTVDKKEAINLEELPDLLTSVRSLYEYMERWAGGESGPMVKHAREMWKQLQTMLMAFYYHQEIVAMRQVLAKVKDEDLRDELEDQIDKKVHAASRFAEAVHGGADPANDFAWKIPQFLEAYSHATNPAAGLLVSKEQLRAALAAADEALEEAMEEDEAIGEEEEEEEDDDPIVVEESTH